ncbi:MAG: Asp-tRNA(Asn)/Glu-tRNA(Gln) amidotransferase GatCAB subunit B, partial [Spirochaetaceae bacterium]|nr:Asp-tRNA(Asn)/Glu-tRNA(Gln) amidotransferase GatCAB subunit B [Spirochaetaceae bacterium]
QGALLDQGKPVVQETRLWNENRDQTEPMRTKENAKDYRYFPEPDLPVFEPDSAFLASVDAALVELPRSRMKRFMADYGLPEEQAEKLCDEKAGADYVEAAVTEAVRRGLEQRDAAERIANWFLTDIKHILSREGISPEELSSFTLSPRRLAALVIMTARGEVSLKNARQAAELILAEDKEAEDLIRERGWERIADPEKIARSVENVYAEETAVFGEVRSAHREGNAKRANTLTAYLVGKVLSATGGRADPGIVRSQVEALIAKSA